MDKVGSLFCTLCCILFQLYMRNEAGEKQVEVANRTEVELAKLITC